MREIEESSTFRAGFVLGFHGCDVSTANAIFSGRTKHLRPSKNSYDWLGSGIYFWETSPTRAHQYAQISMIRPSPNQGRIHKPAVIGAVLEMGNCLDLLDAQYFDVVRKAHKLLKDIAARSGRPMPVNRSLGNSTETILRDLDCSVINLVHQDRRDENLRPFDSVRAAFIEGRPLYEGASFYDLNHIQICVRNPKCIKGYFRPLA
jgi:hypothetical protein